MVIHKNQLNFNPAFVFKILSYVSNILFPSYPCYYFPCFLLIQMYNKLVSLKKNPRIRVIPLPNKLYNILVENQPFLSDHFCFVSDEIFDKYGLNSKNNWLNITFGNNKNDLNQRIMERSMDIVETILTKQSFSVLVRVIAVPNCQRNCIFVSENCFQNWCNKNKIRNEQPLMVYLKKRTSKQNLPVLAARATVFLVKSSHELPFDVTDEIITNYFSTPRVLFRNHTYEIDLNEQQVGKVLYSEYFHIFIAVEKLYFRCIHLESANNQFENFALVAKGTTTLHQSTSINYPIPQQHLDDFSFINACPWGLSRYYDYLKSCILPFVGNAFYTSSNNTSPSTNTDTSQQNLMTTNKIFPAFLLQGDQGSGKRSLVKVLARGMGFQLYDINCAEIMSNSVPAQTEAKLKIAFSQASNSEPVILTMNNFELFGIDNEGNEDLRALTAFQSELHDLFIKERTYPVILIAVSNGKITKPIIQSQFLEIVSIETPNKEERFDNLQWLFHKEIVLQEIFNGCLHSQEYTDIPLWNGCNMKAAKYQLGRRLRCVEKSLHILQTIADQTQGFHFSDLKMLFENSITNLLQCRERCSIFQMDNCLEAEQFEKNLHEMQREFSDSLGYG